MACGDIDWWRAPDLEALLVRHGLAEHLIVQVDFIFQAWRNPRAEFSIPGASKAGSGGTGYADVVSLASHEIWEIKPKHLAKDAAREAEHYVEFARAQCGPLWVPGTRYTASNRLGGGGVVFRLEGGGNKAELIAEQGSPGVITYEWRINGKRMQLKDAARFSWAIRAQVVTDYFTAGQPPQPLPGARPPHNLPPIKFKPPVLRPDACIPQLAKLVGALLQSLRTTCQQTMVENSTVAILLEERMVDALVGPSIVNSAIVNVQVKAGDPTVRLYREALALLTSMTGVTGIAGILVALYFAIGELIVGIGGVIAFVCTAVAEIGTAALVTGAAEMGFVAALRSGVAQRAVLAAGASLVAFAIPRAASASTGTTKPVPLFDISFPQFLVLKPGTTGVRLGRTFEVDGGRWVVVGIATT